MPAVEHTALILLAAGRSLRFGVENKLLADFLGRPLGLHVVTALEDVAFAARIAVVDDDVLAVGARGYTVVRNDAPEQGLSRSVGLGIAAARGLDVDAALILLADMPRVTVAHVLRLFDAAKGGDAVVASSDGVRPGPPALFGRGHFDALCALQGDEGARPLIRTGRHVVASPEELIDIDTPDDLVQLRALVGTSA